MHLTHAAIISGLVLLAPIITGCSSMSRADRELAASANRPIAQAQIRLAESASAAAAAQEELVRIQTARTLPAPAPINENLAGVPEALRRPTTMQWSGPGEEPTRRIAGIVGYDFRVVGNPPATKPMINVSLDNVPAVKALEDIGNQVQPFAQIVVDANLKRIEYRYLVVAGAVAAPTAPGMTK